MSADVFPQAQDLVRCQLCESPAETVCNTCGIELCKACVGDHVISAIGHVVVPFRFQTSNVTLPKCEKHSETSEYYCVDCSAIICWTCLVPGLHRDHTVRRLSESQYNSEERQDITQNIEPAWSRCSKKTKEILVVPKLLTTVSTGYFLTYRVACGLKPDRFYVSGIDKLILCLDTNGKTLDKHDTKSGHQPEDLAVTKDENLIYIDHHDRSINKVKDGRIECLISLQNWRPKAICSTSTNDFLVTMMSEDETQAKGVRYCGSKVEQEIQFYESGKSLYLNPCFIDENGNLDVVVSDFNAKSVIVVTMEGKFKFSYHGNPEYTQKRAFNPYGVSTDTMSNILVADSENDVIHIIDRNGDFLLCIDTCNLQHPYDLCVDNNDLLYVAELKENKVKQIKYLE